MSVLSNPIALPAAFTRTIAIAALMGATMLTSPLTAARADGVINAPIQLAQATPPQHKPIAKASHTKGETVEQRIATLHAELKITPDEQTAWNGVAQAMRDNAAAMQKLVAERTAQGSQDMTAVDDLKDYQKFAQAHVDGLANLATAFETLYNSMPDAQKKVADKVFLGTHSKGARSHS
jgi:hypothetical protein